MTKIDAPCVFDADIAANKKALRQILRANRAAFFKSPAAKQAQKKIIEGLLGLIEPMVEARPQRPMIALYAACGSEVDIFPLMASLKTVADFCLPVIEGGARVLGFHPYEAGQRLEKSAFGINAPLPDGAPVTPDMIIMPLLGFDKKGHRLGQGGGYYDATLSHLAKNGAKPLKIGVGFACQAQENIPHQAHDVLLDWIVDETGSYGRFYGLEN